MEFTLNPPLLQFMQKLTELLETYIGNSDYKEYVRETLDIAGRFIDRLSESAPDLLYGRLENLDEEDILTYSELDKSTDSAVWICIDSFLALVVYQSYKAVGQRYLPQTVWMKIRSKIILFIISNWLKGIVTLQGERNGLRRKPMSQPPLLSLT